MPGSTDLPFDASDYERPGPRDEGTTRTACSQFVTLELLADLRATAVRLAAAVDELERLARRP